MAIRSATQQDTECHIFRSGFGMFPWWGAMRREFEYADQYNAPDGWVWVVEYEHPAEEGSRTASVTHADVMRAVHLISEGNVKYATETLVRECRNLLFRVDDADLDAADADSVLQVAVMGRIHYG